MSKQRIPNMIDSLLGGNLNETQTEKNITVPVDKPKTEPPFSELFSKDKDDIDTISESMKKGYDNNFPIFVLQDGEEYLVIDGHTRLEIAKELGLKEIPILILNITKEEALEYAIRIQVERRNLKDRDIFRCVQTNDNLKRIGRPSLNSSGEPIKFQGIEKERLAKLFNTSATKVQKCFLIISKGTDEIHVKILSGNMSINRAYNIIQNNENVESQKIEEDPLVFIEYKNNTISIITPETAEPNELLTFSKFTIEKKDWNGLTTQLINIILKSAKKIFTKHYMKK